MSQLVVVLKDTAIGASYGNYVPALIVIALLMISVNFTLSWFATWLEGRMRRSKRGGTPLQADAVEQEGAPGARAV